VLKITLRPGERVVVNGCVLRNGSRRQSITVENRADIVRESDLLDAKSQATPVSKVYFMLQNALINPASREEIVPMIQSGLAGLATCFGADMRSRIMQAANNVSIEDYYKAMSELRPVLKYEAELLAMRLPERVAKPVSA